MSSAEDEFAMWVSRNPRLPGQLSFRGALLKRGQKVAKFATYAIYGDSETGQTRRRELAFKSIHKGTDGPGYNYSSPDVNRWYCEDDEIDRLLAFLNSDVEDDGRYSIVDTSSPAAALVKMMENKRIDSTSLANVLIERIDLNKLIETLARTTNGQAAAELAVIRSRRDLVARLKEMSANPSTTETDLQRSMGNAYWIFGGRYVGVAERRNLAPLDQHDIPLVEADGTLHIVELKGPNVSSLIRRHRNHFIVGNEVHEAVSQTMNYIRSLDEHGASLSTTYRRDFGQDYDMRRVFATVVIGHALHVKSEDRHAVEQTIRSYNSHLSRVQVTTYTELFDAAERSLRFQDISLSKENAKV